MISRPTNHGQIQAEAFALREARSAAGVASRVTAKMARPTMDASPSFHSAWKLDQ